MEYRLDKYNNKISVLGYGCMRFTQKAGKINIKKLQTDTFCSIFNILSFYRIGFCFNRFLFYK